MQKFLLLTVGLFTIVGLGMMIDWQSKSPVKHDRSRDALAAVYAPGRIEGATPEVELRPWMEGRIDEVFVLEGDQVKEGDVLLHLENEQLRHEQSLAAAEFELAIAERQRLRNGPQQSERLEAKAMYEARLADLEKGKLAWERISNLRADGVVAQREADNHRTQVLLLSAQAAAAKARVELLCAPPRDDELTMADARVRAAEARLKMANMQLDRTKLRAPRGGTVLQINVEVGELVGPKSVHAAVIVADTSTFRVRAFVDEIDVPRIHSGQVAHITVDGLPGEAILGEIAELRPRLSQKVLTTDSPNERFDTKTREIWIDLEPNKACKHLVCGLGVDVKIDIEMQEPADEDYLNGPGSTYPSDSLNQTEIGQRPPLEDVDLHFLNARAISETGKTENDIR